LLKLFGEFTNVKEIVVTLEPLFESGSFYEKQHLRIAVYLQADVLLYPNMETP